ncbi:MAG: hypothetical protein AAB116_11110 [Candidatus Poribacteria bacterium]
MKLKETVKKEIEKMDIDEILLLYEQIKLFKKKKNYLKSKYSIDEILELTATSKSSWSDEVIKERQERG